MSRRTGGGAAGGSDGADTFDKFGSSALSLSLGVVAVPGSVTTTYHDNGDGDIHNKPPSMVRTTVIFDTAPFVSLGVATVVVVFTLILARAGLVETPVVLYLAWP